MSSRDFSRENEPSPVGLLYVEIEFDSRDERARETMADLLRQSGVLEGILEEEIGAFLKEEFDAALPALRVKKGSILITLLIVTYGLLGSYGSMRQGLDRLVRDVTGIARSVINRMSKQQINWEVRTHAGERIPPQSSQPTPVGLLALSSVPSEGLARYLVWSHLALTVGLMIIVALLIVHGW
jgi:hypothetical protein